MPDGVKGHELFRDPLCLIQHKDRKNEKIDSGDLLLLEQGHCLRAHVMQGYAISEKQLSSFSCSSVSTLVAMIDMNLGMSFLPKIAIDFGVLSPYPNLIAKSNCQASRGIGIVYRKNNYQAENIKKIAESLRT